MKHLVYSFPWEIGAPGIGYTAWCHVEELAKSSLSIHLFAGKEQKQFSSNCVQVHQTRTLGNLKLPAKIFGGMDNAARFHDWRVAQYIRRHHADVLAFHGWPTASELSIAAAKAYGIPTFLERPNAHTRLAYEIAERIAQETGVAIGRSASHRSRDSRLAREEREYAATDYLLCPSEFVLHSFLDEGFAPQKLLRHQYGFSPDRIPLDRKAHERFRAVFIGNDAARKGLHHILQAWRQSDADKVGELHIFGRIDDTYLAYVQDLLQSPSVHYHGFSTEVSAYLNSADIFLLSSFEEGSALVTYEARAAGCVLLVSAATGAVCQHGINALVHEPGDVTELTQHINLLVNNREKLEELRQASLAEREQLTWAHAATVLKSLYENPISTHRDSA